MSHPGGDVPELGLDALADRLRNSLGCHDDDAQNVNKPDFRELDLGSPVSPLRIRPGGLITSSSTSSSSSSSGSMTGRNGSNRLFKRSNSGGDNHSGELSVSVESSPTASASRGFRYGQVRSDSGGSQPLIYSGGSTVNSPPPNIFPTGNICPSGRIVKTGMAGRSSKTDVLGSGTGNYGHGSVVRGGTTAKSGGVAGSVDVGGIGAMNSRGLAGAESSTRRVLASTDPEELKRVGNEQHKKGNFVEALSMYERAISMSPGNAAYHCNRAAALMGLKRLPEAIRECEEAIRLDPGYVRAHHRLGYLFISLGQVENGRRHICFHGHQPDPVELQKLQAVEKHLRKCTDARKVGHWKSTLREGEAAIASGADASPQLFACRAEALLKLHQLDDADVSMSNVLKFESSTPSCSQAKFFGMLSEAYVFFVQAQIEMAQGRFENAIAAVEKAGQIDPRNVEVLVLLKNVKLVGRARARGNDLFKSERFTEACSAYGDGLRLDPSNSVLFCNRAACWFKLGQWERAIDDCNQALLVQPRYTKALLRRAASNSKLERWAEAVRDYEVLRRELPYDNEVAESLFHCQIGLKKSRGEEVDNMKFGGDMELVLGLEQFNAAILSPCASVVHFKTASSLQCKQISPFLDALRSRYPSIKFLEVDVEESPAIANAESVRIVPTFKIYIRGIRVKEMVCPSPDVLEASVRHYRL